MVLKNLRLDQTGEYYCKASGPSGAIKTKPATLKVLGMFSVNVYETYRNVNVYTL